MLLEPKNQNAHPLQQTKGPRKHHSVSEQDVDSLEKQVVRVRYGTLVPFRE